MGKKLIRSQGLFSDSLDFKFTLKKLPVRVHEQANSYDLFIAGKSCRKMFLLEKKRKNELKLKKLKNKGKRPNQGRKEMLAKENFGFEREGSSQASKSKQSQGKCFDWKNVDFLDLIK